MTSSRTCAVAPWPITAYDPRSTISAARFFRIAANVSGERLSVSGRAKSSFVRATSSPEMVRSFFPTESSDLSISVRAVDSQADSAPLDRFLNPSTAADWRYFIEGPGAGSLPVRLLRSEEHTSEL